MVAIILIIAAIAIPHLLEARMSANEASAAENLRTITTASIVYNSTWNNGFPPTFATFGGPARQCFHLRFRAAWSIHAGDTPPTKRAVINSRIQLGRTVAVKPRRAAAAAGFQHVVVTATPLMVGFTGNRSFCSDQPGIIHFDTTGATTASQAACEALPALQ